MTECPNENCESDDVTLQDFQEVGGEQIRFDARCGNCNSEFHVYFGIENKEVVSECNDHLSDEEKEEMGIE